MDIAGYVKLKLIKMFILLVAFMVCLRIMTVMMIIARRSRPAYTAEGELVMRYNLFMRLFFAGPSLFGPIGFGVLAIIISGNMPLGVQVFIGLLILAWILGARFVALDTLTVQVIVSDQGIGFYSWRKTCAYSWDDIEDVSTMSWTYPFVFHGSDGRKFTISALMSSVPLLVKMFRKNLERSVYRKARRGIEWHGGDKLRIPLS